MAKVPDISLSITAILVGTLAFLWVRSWNRLRHIPGPFIAGWTKLWMFFNTVGGRMHLVVQEAGEKYGDLVRVGPNEVITRNPDDWRRILAVRSDYVRSQWFECVQLEPGIENVLSERNDKLHTMQRAKMAIGYSGREIDNLEGTINHHISAFVNLLKTKYISTEKEYKPVEFSSRTQYFTLDLATAIAFGKAVGAVANDADPFEYIQTWEFQFPFAIWLGIFPSIITLLHTRFFKFLQPKPTDKYGMGRMSGIAQEAVAERFAFGAKDKKDMLGSFIRHGLTQKESEAESILQIVAGFDTTAGALRATMLHIVSNPHVYSRLLAEIASTSISSPITDGEARNMPYLQAVIKEGLRIQPPISGLAFRVVPPGGDHLSGSFLPGGTNIGYNFFGMMKDPKIWGDDAKLFRPERWLSAAPEQLKKMEANVDLAFAYGKWLCLGRTIALMELNKFFVELLRHFDFTIVNTQRPWKLYNASIHITSDMWMRVTERQPAL